jgi:hypothetical protein
MSGFFGSKRSARPGRSWLSRRGGFLAVAGAGVMFVGTAVVALACTDIIQTNVVWGAGAQVTGNSAQDVVVVTGEYTLQNNGSYSVDDGTPTGKVTFNLYTGTCPSSGVLPTGTSIWTDSGVALGAGSAHDTATATSTSTGPLGAGSYYFFVQYSGDSTYKYGAYYGPCEPFTVGQYAPPTVTTVYDSTGVVWTSKETTGASAYDMAKVTTPVGAPTATGNVTYKFFSDSTSTQGCTGTWSSAGTVSVGTKSATEGSLAAGSYSFSATYKGDSNYASQTGACEPFTVTKATPGISTQTVPGSPVTIGTQVYDTATLTGATSNAGGTVTYGLYSDSSCKDLVKNLTPTPTSNNVLNGTVPKSTSYTFTSVGTWYFAASYSGDGNNLPAASVCTNELLTVRTTSTPNPTPTPTSTPTSTPTPTATPTGRVLGSTPTPTPSGAVLGITVPDTGGAGPTGGGWGWLSPILVLLGSLVLVAQFVVRRRVRSGKIKIQDI